MASLTEIDQFVRQTLNAEAIADDAVNGIQVRGREAVGRVVSGVSACLALFEAALEAQADLVLVHHGLLWRKMSTVVEGSYRQRLAHLLRHDLTLMAHHLPLDLHPELGNNAQLLQRLRLTPERPFGHYHGVTLSWIGCLAAPLPVGEFVQQVAELTGVAPRHLDFGPALVTRVAVCSGGAPDLVWEAKAMGADLFLTGETTEYVYHFAKEEGIHFVAAGHHASERLGVQALGGLLAARFGLHHQFIDIPNPL